jgi:hypothetical protein
MLLFLFRNNLPEGRECRLSKPSPRVEIPGSNSLQSWPLVSYKNKGLD